MCAMMNDSLEVAMELYSTLVPNTFSPNLDFYRTTLEQIKLQVGFKHMPRLWTDLQTSQFCGSGIKSKWPMIETFVSTLTEADLEIFTDCVDAENEEKRNLLNVSTII